MAASRRPGARSPGSAQRPTAPAERSQPRRAARRTMSAGSRSSRVSSSSRKEPRRFCSVSSRASATAISVRAATAATWRYSPASAPPLPSSSTAPSSWPPDTIGTSAATSPGRSGLPPASRLATYRSSDAQASTGAPRRGTITATGAPACVAAMSATRSRPSPARTAPTISRWAPRGDGRDSGAVIDAMRGATWPGDPGFGTTRILRPFRPARCVGGIRPPPGSPPSRGPGARAPRPRRCGCEAPPPPG